MKNRKNIIIAIIAILFIAGGFGVYTYWKANESTIELETVTAEYGHVTTKVSGSGKIAAKNTVSTYVESPQTIKTIPVKEGDLVKKGDVLITYDIEADEKELNRQIQEAQLNLKNAQLSLAQISTPASGNELVQYENDVLSSQKNITDAKSEITSLDIKISQQQIKLRDAKDVMDNNKILLLQGGVSQKTYDDSVSAYELYERTLQDLLTQKDQKESTVSTRSAQLDNAKQKLANAKNRLLDDSTALKYEMQQNTITLYLLSIEKLKDDLNKLTPQSLAAADGSIAKVNATEGGIASKNIALITLSKTDEIIAKLDLSEYDAPSVNVGFRAEISTSGLPDIVYNGKVSKISNEAIKKEDSTDDEVIVPIEIEIADLDDKLKIGYSVDIDIYIQEKTNVLCLPIQTVVEYEGMPYCYTQNGAQFNAVKIETSLYGDKYIEIISGISEGDKIVLTPWEVPPSAVAGK